MLKRLISLICSITILCALLLPVSETNAAELGNRSVSISTSIPAAQSTQVFTFSVPNTSILGSIVFEHCDNSPLYSVACNAPSGLSLITATLTSETTNTGFAIDIVNSSANKIVLTRIPGAATIGVSSYTFDGVVNSNVPNQTNYVRISTHASIDGSGARTNEGAVAYAITGSFSVGAFVPPYLIFCAAVTVALDCSSTSGVLMSLGELSTSQTKTATSQFSGATNDFTGYSVSIIGQTMTAGNQIIPSLASQTASSTGVSQFGINLRQNTSPFVGADPSGVGTAYVNASYDIPNVYMFNNGDQLVSSTISTDYNLHTVSYIVNISSSQQPGYYATTLTYVATAAF